MDTKKKQKNKTRRWNQWLHLRFVGNTQGQRNHFKTQPAHSIFHCFMLREEFQPLAENAVANLVEVAVPLLTSFRADFMVWAAAN